MWSLKITKTWWQQGVVVIRGTLFTFFCLQLACTWIQFPICHYQWKWHFRLQIRRVRSSSVLQILLLSSWLCGKVFKDGFWRAMGFWRVCWSAWRVLWEPVYQRKPLKTGTCYVKELKHSKMSVQIKVLFCILRHRISYDLTGMVSCLNPGRGAGLSVLTAWSSGDVHSYIELSA